MASRILTGFTVGLIVGILLAPDKGSESRKKLVKAGKDLKDKFNDFVDGLNDKFESAKDEAEDLIQNPRSQSQTFAGDY